MIADKVRQEDGRFFSACIRRNQMHAIGRFVKALSSLVYGFHATLDLHPHRAVQNVADHRAGVAVGC